MTMDDAFFDELEAINADLTSGSARLDQLGGNPGDILVISRDDTETLEAVARIQAAQKRLTALLATVPD
ncbi:hypothetical protein [Microbacterium aerolatum]|uniref:hypothetical protein n=1 Tax=Microbacterium aerolatum TaxID=153731 RepID=UPI0038509F54